MYIVDKYGGVMKFLLVAVNAKYIHSNLAIYDLRAYCSEYRSDIELAEYTVNDSPEHILEDIYRRMPDAAAFSCYIWNIVIIEQIIRELHKILPHTELWLGGPEVSYRAEGLLQKHLFLKGIIAGEGERAFRQLMEYYQTGGRKLCEIQNLFYRDKDGLHSNPQGGPIDLSKLPFPYEDLADFENRIIYYESSRGCPFSCSYCLSSVEKKLRFRDLSMVKKELQFFLDRKTKQVKFVDRTFNARHDHSMEIWRYLYEHDNGVTNFHFEIAADLLTEEELALLQRMRPGLVQLEIGVQSANDRTIREIHRTMRLDRVKRAVEKLRQNHNIHLHLDLIAGLPYEDYESFRRSFDEIYAMKPDMLQLGFLKVLSGTELAREAEKYGLVFRETPPYEVLFTKWISFRELLKLKGVEEMVEIYYNSAQFGASMAMLLPYFRSPYQMYDALASYYRQEGLISRSQNRQEVYESLLFFAEKFLEGQERDRLRECLTYDLYLRENRKNRPEFALDDALYKEEKKAFYRAEAKKHKYLPDYQGYDGKQLAKMTHLEHFFTHPLTGKRQEMFLLFDYQNRSPRSLNAAATEIRKGELDTYAGI